MCVCVCVCVCVYIYIYSPQTMEWWHSAAILLAQRHYTNFQC